MECNRVRHYDATKDMSSSERTNRRRGAAPLGLLRRLSGLPTLDRILPTFKAPHKGSAAFIPWKESSPRELSRRRPWGRGTRP